MIIQPCKGLKLFNECEILFGNSRQEVRTILKEKPQPFYKDINSKILTDSFNSFPLHSYYKLFDNMEVLEALEIFSEANPIFLDRAILKIKYQELVDWFKILDPNANFDDEDGLTTYKYGLAFSAPGDTKDINYKPESVLVFERGYYDRSP